MKHYLIKILISLSIISPAQLFAANYVIDTAKQHAFITFKISHLGYSFIMGRFDDFTGTFSYDAAHPEKSQVAVTIKTTSVNTNHAARDDHLRTDDFLAVAKFPEATFKSTRFETKDGITAKLSGILTLRGVSKPIVIDVTKIGEGNDPWGGYRAGFEGVTKLTLKDFGIPKDLGPASAQMDMQLSIEGVRQ